MRKEKILKMPKVLDREKGHFVSEQHDWAIVAWTKSKSILSSKTTFGTFRRFATTFRRSSTNCRETTTRETLTTLKMRLQSKVFRRLKRSQEIICRSLASHIRKIISWWQREKTKDRRLFPDGWDFENNVNKMILNILTIGHNLCSTFKLPNYLLLIYFLIIFLERFWSIIIMV